MDKGNGDEIPSSANGNNSCDNQEKDANMAAIRKSPNKNFEQVYKNQGAVQKKISNDKGSFKIEGKILNLPTSGVSINNYEINKKHYRKVNTEFVAKNTHSSNDVNNDEDSKLIQKITAYIKNYELQIYKNFSTSYQNMSNHPETDKHFNTRYHNETKCNEGFLWRSKTLIGYTKYNFWKNRKIIMEEFIKQSNFTNVIDGASTLSSSLHNNYSQTMNTKNAYQTSLENFEQHTEYDDSGKNKLSSKKLVRGVEYNKFSKQPAIQTNMISKAEKKTIFYRAQVKNQFVSDSTSKFQLITASIKDNVKEIENRFQLKYQDYSVFRDSGLSMRQMKNAICELESQMQKYPSDNVWCISLQQSDVKLLKVESSQDNKCEYGNNPDALLNKESKSLLLRNINCNKDNQQIQYNRISIKNSTTSRQIEYNKCPKLIRFNHDVNPFCTIEKQKFLGRICFKNQLSTLNLCQFTNRKISIYANSQIRMRDKFFFVKKIIGKGSYGIVWCAEERSSNKMVALKVERPINLWEYYISFELKKRLTNVIHLSGFIDIQYALIGNNTSILVSEFAPYGSFVDVINRYKNGSGKNLDECIVMIIARQVLTIINQLYISKIIHGDIKSDNFLLMKELSYPSDELAVKLIDFGLSIDMTLYPLNQVFMYRHSIADFECIEMREERPWTYQLDLFGTAGVIHSLLYGQYMCVDKKSDGNWLPRKSIPKYLDKYLWNFIFQRLLNITNCENIPNLSYILMAIDSVLAEKEEYVIDKIIEFNNYLK